MSSWHSPQSIFNVGSSAIKDLFSVPVQVQEKVDGSFFAFGLYTPAPFDLLDPNSSTVELRVRSKGAVMTPEAPASMFKPAVKAVQERLHLLHPGWMYRGETLIKTKHNALDYDRVPKDNVILFDVLTEDEEYLTYEELVKEGERIGLEVVPQLFSGMVGSAQELRQFLDRTSILGGQKIEGVVIKPLTPLYGPDKKMLFGKFVSEAFKEVHRKAWGESNPGPKDIILRLGEQYCSQARWQKALQHLREAGKIVDHPKDIALLVEEIPADIRKECEAEIKEELFKYAWPHIRRMVMKGMPEWYKQQLLNKQFEEDSAI